MNLHSHFPKLSLSFCNVYLTLWFASYSNNDMWNENLWKFISYTKRTECKHTCRCLQMRAAKIFVHLKMGHWFSILWKVINGYQYNNAIRYEGRIQLLLKRLPDSKRLFPNLSWLTSGRTSGHQNLVSIFPGIDKTTALRLNTQGWLSTLCCWEAAIHTLD